MREFQVVHIDADAYDARSDTFALNGILNQDTRDFPVICVNVIWPFDLDLVSRAKVMDCMADGQRDSHIEIKLVLWSDGGVEDD
jgi:hypothetical protein